MTEAYRCDITDSCIAEADSPNNSWVVAQDNNATVLGVTGVKITVGVKVNVFQDGTQTHLNQTARDAVTQIVKTMVAGA